VVTYEYECGCCGRFEYRHSITLEAMRECPRCSGPCKKIVGAGGVVIFRGSGFYCNDKKDKPRPKEEQDERA